MEASLLPEIMVFDVVRPRLIKLKITLMILEGLGYLSICYVMGIYY